MTRSVRRCPAMTALTLSVLLCVAGCATAPVPVPPPGPVTLPAAVAAGVDQVMSRQAQQRGWPAFLAEAFAQPLYVAPVADTQSRQQTRATVAARALLVERVSQRFPAVKVSPMSAVGAGASVLRLDGALSAVVDEQGTRRPGRHVLTLRLLDVAGGAVVAESRTEIDDRDLDATPTAFFQDSPVTMPAPAPVVGTAAPPVPERARTDAMGRLDEADAAYEAKAHGVALALYRQVAAQPGADRMRALVGAYLSASRLGDEAQARAVFADIVAQGLQAQALGVKLLFTPGKTEFWPDEAISRPYAGWLQEIARQAGAGTACLQVVGHSSRSGGEAFNLSLSAQRAGTIRSRLEADNPALARRVSIDGVGWRENLVGTGTDDLRDAVDRRVEFKVAGCP